jgi:hypothetical protein
LVFNGVPCLTFPHVESQAKTASNLIGKGAALPLFDVTIAEREEDGAGESLTFNTPLFTANQFTERMGELLTNPKYGDAMMVLKTAAVASGGPLRAEKCVRDYYINSLVCQKGDKCADHLVDYDYIEKTN